MKIKLLILNVVFSGSLVWGGTAAAEVEDPDFKKMFSELSVEGTLVIASEDNKLRYVHNTSRLTQGFLPASTFKIPNTLIALNAGAVRDEHEIIKWDGVDKGWDAWNNDQSVETAFPVSCVWFFQELAKRVGNDRYLESLLRLHYGNAKTGRDITTFWLSGDLRVSAWEQILFLQKLYRGELPYSDASMQLVRKMMVIQQTPEYVLRAKTGWTMRVKPQIGWYVGYVEVGEKVWFFAMNMDITEKAQAKYRELLTLNALKVKKIIAQ